MSDNHDDIVEAMRLQALADELILAEARLTLAKQELVAALNWDELDPEETKQCVAAVREAQREHAELFNRSVRSMCLLQPVVLDGEAFDALLAERDEEPDQ